MLRNKLPHKQEPVALDSAFLLQSNFFGFYPLKFNVAPFFKPYFESFQLSSLHHLLGNTAIRAAQSQDGVFGFDPKTGKRPLPSVSMPFTEFCQKLDRNESGPFHYMQENSFDSLASLNKLENICKLPASMKNTQKNLWVGQQGCISPLHFDVTNNFLIQIEGVKKLTLFPAAFSSHLKPYSCLSKAPHMSGLSPEVVYQLSSEKKNIARTIMLYPGEAIYIPAFYWHQVETLEKAVSINIWWKIMAKQHLNRLQLLHLMPHNLRNLYRQLLRKPKNYL